MSVGKVIETLETEIREYKRMIDERTLCLAGESAYGECQSRIDFAREIIALLRTHPDAQPNEPLTFEELKKMDGKPVWLNTLCEWFFVDASCEPILLWGVRATCYSTVGLLGELYRRPPKEET